MTHVTRKHRRILLVLACAASTTMLAMPGTAVAAVSTGCDPYSAASPPWLNQQPALATTRHYREWRETTATTCTNITDQNILKYNKEIDPATGHEIGHGVHTVGWTPGVHTLYRTDERPPSVVFHDGFTPFDTSEQSNLALNPGIGVHNSGLVSTTWNPGYAASFGGHPYVYVIRATGGWYRYDDLGEGEVAFPGGIRAQRIVGVLAKSNNAYTWKANPGYQEPAADDDNGDFADMASNDPVYLASNFPTAGATRVYTPVSVPGWTIYDDNPKALRHGAEVLEANDPVVPPANGPADANVYRTYHSDAGIISEWQTIPTVAGHRYAVAYSAADGNIPGVAPTLKDPRVAALSVEAVNGPFWTASRASPLATENTPWQLLQGSGKDGPAKIRWLRQTIQFTALSGLTTISFQRAKTTDNNAVLFTDISMHPVPTDGPVTPGNATPQLPACPKGAPDHLCKAVAAVQR